MASAYFYKKIVSGPCPVEKIQNLCIETPISSGNSARDNEDHFTLSEDHCIKLALRLLRDTHNHFSVVSAYRGNTCMSENEKELLKQYLKELGDLADKI